jgi:hypothetical protein
MRSPWYGNDFFPSSGYFGRGFQTSSIFAHWFFMKKPLMQPSLLALMLLPALGAGACLADGDYYGVYICATGFVGITFSYVVPRFAAFEFIELKCRVFDETLHPEFLAHAHAKDAIISKNSHSMQRQKKSIQDLSSDLCPICLENFSEKNNIFHTPCNHDFHTYCLARWVQKHFSCPYCKSSLGRVLIS